MQEVALITGASAGIGHEFAKIFAAKGHDLVLVARREEKLKQIADELREKHGVTIHVVASDLGDPTAPGEIFAETQRLGLRVSILVNNAGLLCEGEFTEMAIDPQTLMLQVNIQALTALTHHYVTEMKQAGEGRVLNVCSSSAFQPVPTVACYAASKAYVLSFSEALNVELGGSGVSVTCICPGFTNTDMIHQGDRDKGMSLPLLKNLEPEEVAAQGYAACMARKPLYVNGLSNKLLTSMSDLQPRWVQRLIAKQVSGRGF